LGLFKTKQGDYLLIAVHHLVIDGVSLRILLEDFHEGFRQVMKGETITFPLKTHSFQYWSKRLQEYASGEEILKELKYWSNQDPAEIKPLPVKRYARKELKKIKNVNMLRVSLGREQTHLLLTDTNKSYNTDIKDILLATLGIAIHKWAGLEKIAMNMEGHGREKIMDNVNIERTIGFFTTQFPVILEIHGNSDLPAVINQAKDTMRRIPHNGIGYGILKYLTPEEKKDGYRFRMKPEINFNYLGEFGQENNGKDRIFSYTNKGEGESVSLEMELMYPLTVFGIIIAGRLAINLLYNKHEFDLKQMEQLRDCLEEALTGIIDHCTTRIKN
jgi:non-ribosomal peptide synthase protein (TIGR01720 family)